jgi:hypothetical protein
MSRSISMPSPSELSKLKKDQLKEACKERNLPISGNKPDLVRKSMEWERRRTSFLFAVQNLYLTWLERN